MTRLYGHGLLLLFCLIDMPLAFAGEPLITISQVQTVASNNYHHPPADTAAWRSVALPDNWNETRPGRGGGAWYLARIHFDDDAHALQGVLLNNISMNASIWWDGNQLASGGRMSEPVARNWHRPLYATIPVVQAVAGDHWLHIHVRGYANDASGLGIIHLGPESLLLPQFETALFVDQTLSSVALYITLALGLSALMLLYLMPGQRAFLWIAVASIFWTLAISNFVVRDPPMSRFYWESLCQSAVDFYAFGFMLVIHRMLDIYRPRLEMAVFALLLAGWGWVLLFGSDAEVMTWAMPMHNLAVLISFYMIMLCVWRWYRNRDREAMVTGIAVAIVFAFGAHDWWVVYFADQIEQKLWMQFGPTIALLIVAVWTVRRFAGVMKVEEAHLRQIQQEVELITSRLHQEQAEAARIEQQQLLAREREGFMRELHDGIGGHLAALSCMLKDCVVDKRLFSATVDQALLDMRIAVDGIGEDCPDVGMVMGMLRHRLLGRLQAMGLSVSWNMQGLPECCLLPEGRYIHLLRIVQEALTNVVRHAEADWVEVRASANIDADMVCIDIVDNGKGLKIVGKGGRGMANMKDRAKMLDGVLEIAPVAFVGTRVRLMLPVEIRAC